MIILELGSTRNRVSRFGLWTKFHISAKNKKKTTLYLNLIISSEFPKKYSSNIRHKM